ncbi:MAG: sugar transferase [Phycisphaerae bacterium]|nr:sugar transferase [Phycisphaerae bacterium]
MTAALHTMDAPSLLAALQAEGESAVRPAGGWFYRGVKRIVDILGAVVLLVALLPLMLLVAAVIKLTSRGPVLFRQTRAGKDGRPFTMVKFRTMRPNAEEDQVFLREHNYQNGPIFKMPDDPRLIWAGKFLRRSSIDELPQLFNVLIGQMSLVGPRPLWKPEADQAEGPAKLRTMVKPGLTCLWQISGRSELTYEQWIVLDLYYITHRSLLLDLMILLQTLPAVLSTHGAY